MSWEMCNDPLYSDLAGVAATPNIVNNSVTNYTDSEKYSVKNVNTTPTIYEKPVNARPIIYVETAKGPIIYGRPHDPDHIREGFVSENCKSHKDNILVCPDEFGPSAIGYEIWKQKNGYRTY